MQASTGQFATTVAGASMTVDHQVTWTLPPSSGLSRINLCTDPSFEGSTTPWRAGGGPTPTLALSSIRAFSGSKSLLITWGTGLVGIPGAYYLLTTTPGLTYTVSAYVWVPSGSIAVNFGSGFVTSGPSTLNDQWQRLNLTFTATSVTELLALAPFGSPTSGQQCYLDAVLVEQSSTLGSYFDGNTANAFWMGDPNRSTSQLNVNLYQDVSLVVESLTVDRQLTTDMPDGTRLITGYPAASATITLSGLIDSTPGASKSITWLMNPAESTSPLYRSDALGSPITIKAGLYLPGLAAPELFTVFTGTVDDYTVDMKDGTVALTCLDYRGRFSTAPQLPLAAFSSSTVSGTYLTGASGQLLTSGWVLNLMLESIGRYTSPPPRSQAVARITNHGGTWPELGPQAALQVGALPAAVSVPGKFAQQVPSSAFAQWWNNPPVGNPNGTLAGDIGSSGNSWFFECWIKTDTTTAATVSPNTALQCTLNNTGGSPGVEIEMGAVAASVGAALTPYAFVFLTPSFVTTQVTAPSATIPNDGQWHYYSVAFHFTSTTAFTVSFTVDAVSQTANGTLGAAATAHIAPASLLIRHLCPTESIQLTNETLPLSNNGFTASTLVDLDPSLNDLTAVPDVTGQDAWSVIQQIAQAEGAVAGFDELGVFKLINRDTLRVQADQRTITPTYSLKTLDQEMGLSFVRNHIQMPVNKLQVQQPSTVWAATDAIEIPPLATYTQVVTTDNPVVGVSTNGQVMPSGGGTPGLTYFRACTNPNGNGGERTLLTVTVTQLGPASLLLSVTSPYPYPVWLVSPATGAYPASANGLPRMWIGGSFVVSSSGSTDDAASGSTPSAVIADSQWPPLTEGGAVTNPRGERLLVVASNLFLQEVDSGQPFADDLLIDLYEPRPLWRNTQIVTDPRLQLADRVSVMDPVTTMVNDSALIVGVHTSVSRTDWTQSLDLRSIGTPGGWILGVVGRSELAVATYV